MLWQVHASEGHTDERNGTIVGVVRGWMYQSNVPGMNESRQDQNQMIIGSGNQSLSLSYKSTSHQSHKCHLHRTSQRFTHPYPYHPSFPFHHTPNIWLTHWHLSQTSTLVTRNRLTRASPCTVSTYLQKVSATPPETALSSVQRSVVRHVLFYDWSKYSLTMWSMLYVVGATGMALSHPHEPKLECSFLHRYRTGKLVMRRGWVPE